MKPDSRGNSSMLVSFNQTQYRPGFQADLKVLDRRNKPVKLEINQGK